MTVWISAVWEILHQSQVIQPVYQSSGNLAKLAMEILRLRTHLVVLPRVLLLRILSLATLQVPSLPGSLPTCFAVRESGTRPSKAEGGSLHDGFKC